MITSEHSSEIKTEVLQIMEAFGLGSFKGFLSSTVDSGIGGYVLTTFETSSGVYQHYYRIK
jgi:hypothetical protein